MKAQITEETLAVWATTDRDRTEMLDLKKRREFVHTIGELHVFQLTAEMERLVARRGWLQG